MPNQPSPSANDSQEPDEPANEAITLAHEWGHLKRLPRTGWLHAGVKYPETVAEHSLRTAMLAWMIAGLEGADQERATTLAVFHDSQETRTTDLDHVGRNYLSAASNEQVTADQVATLPQPLADHLSSMIKEYEGRSSLEANCARDADKLEMLLQAREYQQQGYVNVDPFIQTAVKSLSTETGRRLAEAALRVEPSAWWKRFGRPPGDKPVV